MSPTPVPASLEWIEREAKRAQSRAGSTAHIGLDSRLVLSMCRALRELAEWLDDANAAVPPSLGKGQEPGDILARHGLTREGL